jgi:hypothetical protein
LGDWKHEFDAIEIAIAGKKLYAVHEINKGWTKTASKGVRLSADDIVSIASGEMCEVKQDAPSFKLDGKHVFITRKIRRTNV